MRHIHDHAQSVDIAERALGHIRRLGLSAEPRSYELWYAYESGREPLLARAMDEILACDPPTPSERDLEDIRRRHLSATDPIATLTALGEKLGDEVEQVMGMIEAAIGVAVGFDEDLSTSNRELAHAIDRDTLRGIVEAVVSATKEMQQENAKLGQSLEESRRDISTLQKNLVSIRLEALTDPLTGLANRRHFDHSLSDALVDADRMGGRLSLLLVDVDHFKRFNDDHGHRIGDQVLRLIAATIKESVDGVNLVARYGGEEFAIILPGTDLAEAVRLAQNIRKAVSEKQIVRKENGERLGRLTVSIGAACRPAGAPAQTLIELTDRCLYLAKRNGRNCVVSDSDAALDTYPDD